MQKSASAYERHQQILNMLQGADSLRVGELSELLGVSESTIRTDLETLDEQGQLIRVRGGAVAKQAESNNHSSPQAHNGNYLEHKATQNQIQKRILGRWAASMIEDGNSIMLDASSTVLHIAQFLLDRRELTVITNGLHVAQLLAKEPTNTVIVLGGVLRPNGNALTGSMSEQLLHDYHIQRAFVSCSGFKPEIGFFEADLQEAQIKSLMLRAATQRFILLDSSKIGRVSLTTFATLDDMDYVVTDSGIERDAIRQIHKINHQTHVVVCDAHTHHIYTDNERTTTHQYRVGFANLSEHTSFSRDVRRGLEQAAQQTQMMDLILADNQLDKDVALRVADHMLNKNIDLFIEYQIDEITGNLIAHKFQQAEVPVIAVDIPMVGATYFGVDNYKAGQMAGEELGKAVLQQWGGHFDNLLVVEQERAGKLLAMRIQGQIDSLTNTLGISIEESKIIRVDFENTVESCYPRVRDALQHIPVGQRIAVVCFNDDAAIGVLQAARETGHIQQLLLVGQGADRRLRREMRHAVTPVVGATAYCPEKYGEDLVQLALHILEGSPVAPAVYMQHFFVSPSNVDVLYPNDADEDISS